MADVLGVTVIIKRNGRYRVSISSEKGSLMNPTQLRKATGGGCETLPMTQIATLQVLASSLTRLSPSD